MGDEAEDVVQDCLLKAFRNLDRLDRDEAAPAWLARILVNCCRDRQRSRARRPQEAGVDDVDDFSLYSLLALMRRLIAPEKQDAVGVAIVVRARCGKTGSAVLPGRQAIPTR